MQVNEVANLLKVSNRRVVQLINEGVLPAKYDGYRWHIKRDDARKLARKKRPVGRPAIPK